MPSRDGASNRPLKTPRKWWSLRLAANSSYFRRRLLDGERRLGKMTIGKRLYAGFGAVLAIMAFLLAINILTVIRQYNARDAVKSTLADVQCIENVRYKIIENRLSLGNYLLSGDLRDEEKTNKGISELQNLL